MRPRGRELDDVDVIEAGGGENCAAEIDLAVKITSQEDISATVCRNTSALVVTRVTNLLANTSVPDEEYFATKV